ncbi:hypothetical protein [Nitrosovibrio sp. Nv4]|uniref:hypothetical protein n=1 Tax=Nitrosovibrio sp. Nv4 TaxID=1945880 RepID=UPI0011814BCA|nr:hypothetical protein [Nitrosovibrio sp. Nv4]
MAAFHSHRYVARVDARHKRVGRSDAAALTERIVLSGLVRRRERDALSRIIVPASLGRSTLSAGVVASGLVAIGRAAISCSAACRSADSLHSRL